MLGDGGDNELSPGERRPVDRDWTTYKQTHNLPSGGMAVYLETPTGNYFACSGMPAGVNQDSRFRIASNTKTFTASALMLLSQQGSSISTTQSSPPSGQGVPYVPATAQYNIPNKSAITIRQLLSHTAGVFDVTNVEIPSTCSVPYAGQNYLTYVLSSDPTHQFSPAELIGVDATCQLSWFAPGTQYRYSNTGYSILATIIERVSGMSYDDFIVSNLIGPNGLSSTSVPMLGTDQWPPSPYTPGYQYYQGVYGEVTQSNMSGNIAEGNIISTPVDLARWIRRLMRGEAGPNTATVDAMKTPSGRSATYGLGITYVNGLGYGHTGAHEGYLSIMTYDPDRDVTTVLYFNVWDGPNLLGDQFNLLSTAAIDARAAGGY